jgi:glycosyltransferase involved in cell wall biosynthesis
MPQSIGVWFPAVRRGTGADMFTIRLVAALNQRGIRADIGWLPPRAEYAPWIVESPIPPSWANIVVVNSWLHDRFFPSNLPVIATLHSCVHDPAFMPYKTMTRRFYHGFWIKRCELNSVRRSTLVTAVSHYTAGRAVEVFGRKDIITIHNWIDLNRFAPDSRAAPQEPFRLLFVGTPRESKGLDLFPAIMQELGSRFELRFTGSAVDIAAHKPLPENIVPIGRLQGDEALVEAYRNCDALLFPTRMEGLPLVAIEAQACGRPVIATRGFSMPEVVEHGKTGFLCPLDDIQAFVASAHSLRDNPSTWRQMSLAARKQAVQKFSENEIVSKYIALYKRVLRI